MSLRVAHVVRSVIAEPGTVSVVLPGLISRLKELGVSSELTERPVDADVVHIHGWDYPAAKAVARAAKRGRRPFVISTLGGACEPVRRRTLADRIRFGLWEKPLLRSARCLAAANAMEMRPLLYWRLTKWTGPIAYGIETSNYAQCTVGDGRRIVFLGSMHPQHGLAELLRVVAELGSAAEGWTVDVAGRDDGDWKAQLQAAIRRKGAEDRVRFVEANDEASQAALLNGASLVVVPSFRYDAGIPILQASAAAVPTLVTRFAAIDLLKDVISVCDPTRVALREALKSMMEMSGGQRKQLGEKGRAACAALCDWTVRAPKFAEMYRKVAEDRR